MLPRTPTRSIRVLLLPRILSSTTSVRIPLTSGATVNVCNWMNLVAAYYPDFKETFPNDGYKAALNLLVGELGEGWSVVDVVAGDTIHNRSVRC